MTTTPNGHHPAVYATWAATLDKLAAGLDLETEDGRVAFRSRVETTTQNTKVSLLRDLAAHVARPVAGNASRWEAWRAVADGYITGHRTPGSTPDAAAAQPGRRLGANQAAVLHTMARRGHWYAGCGWIWDNVSTTTRLLDSLTRRGLVTRTEATVTSGGRYTRYDVTETGRAAARDLR